MSYPATYSDIKTAVINKARLDSTADAAKVGQWVNEAYTQVCAETRCLQQAATATVTANTASYTLDASILHIELIVCTQPGGTAWFPLAEAQLDEILNFRAVSPNSSGPPRRYCLVGMNQIELWPTPTEADTLTFYYSYTPAALSANTDIPLIPEPYASKLLEFGALVQAAEFKRDLMMLGDFQQQYATWLAAFQRYVNRKQGAYPETFPTWTRKMPFGPHDPAVDIPDTYGAWG